MRKTACKTASKTTSKTAIAAIGVAVAMSFQFSLVAARAAPAPRTVAVADFDYVDTSGEPTDQTAAHHQRAADFVSALQRDLAANGQYRLVSMSCGSAPCEPMMNPVELQKAARAAGARFVVLGGVHPTLVPDEAADALQLVEDRFPGGLF